MITVETEKGERLQSMDEFHEILELVERAFTKLSILKWIDPYGDTTFNQVQIREVEQELSVLKEVAESSVEHSSLAKFEELVRFCRSGVHRYLKFYGD